MTGVSAVSVRNVRWDAGLWPMFRMTESWMSPGMKSTPSAGDGFVPKVLLFFRPFIILSVSLFRAVEIGFRALLKLLTIGKDDPAFPSDWLPVTTHVAPCTDWVKSKCILLVEADIAVTHPVAFQWLVDAQKNGTKIIACDTRFTATLSKADVAVVISPNSGNLLGACLMKVLIEESLIHQESGEIHFSDMDIYTEEPAISSAPGKIYPYQTRRQEHWVPSEQEFKALIGSGNCLNDFLSPFRSCARDMDLVVYYGAFPNFTRQSAHMVFPATLWPERYGVCFNNDRILQWTERIVAPSDACRTGLGFWMRLSQRMGWDEYFPWKKSNGLADHAAFYNWLLSNQPETEGISVDLLKEKPIEIFWPYKNGLFRDNAPFFLTESGKMVPAPAPEKSAPLAQEEIQNYPLNYQSTLITSVFSDPGRWQPWTRELFDDKAVQIHPDTAKALGLENGDDIVILANGDVMEGRAWLSRMVSRNMVWSTMRLGYDRVLIYKKGQNPQDALEILRKIL